MMEMFHTDKNIIMTSLLQASDIMTFVLLGWVYLYVTKYWIPFQLVNLGISIACLVIAFVIPESPKYLASIKSFDKTRAILT